MFSRRSSLLNKLLHLAHPSIWGQFIYSPCVYIATILYALQKRLPYKPLINPVSVVCISDTHNTFPQVPDGDILVHAGDLTHTGTFAETQATLDWLNTLPHRHKVIVAGNHDTLLDASRDKEKGGLRFRSQRSQLNWGDIIYLEDESTEIICTNGRKIVIYGSPKSPRHGSPAFQYPRSKDVWTDAVPTDVDILITHCPPRAHLDILTIGCNYLLKEVWRVKPKLHVFGHVHEEHGAQWINFDALQNAYEDIVVNNGGIGRLYRVVVEFVRARLQPPKESVCCFVNASSVGGVFGKRKAPIKVVI